MILFKPVKIKDHLDKPDHMRARLCDLCDNYGRYVLLINTTDNEDTDEAEFGYNYRRVMCPSCAQEKYNQIRELFGEEPEELEPEEEEKPARSNAIDIINILAETLGREMTDEERRARIREMSLGHKLDLQRRRELECEVCYKSKATLVGYSPCLGYCNDCARKSGYVVGPW